MARRPSVKITWNGRQLYKTMEAAAKDGVNATMSDCVRGSRHKTAHPNWKNRTGTAEGSVTIIQFAEVRGFGRIIGVWGSKGVDYASKLERHYGPWLRAQADHHYPKLAQYIRRSFRRRSGGGAPPPAGGAGSLAAVSGGLFS